MRKVIYTVAAIAAILAVGAWSAPSQAEIWNGAIQRDGKCWSNAFPQGIGYWGKCAKPAAAAVAPRRPVRQHRS